MRSPLTQGGLEIQCNVKVVWENPSGLNILKGQVSKYSVEDNERDDSAEILRDLGELVKINIEEDEDAVGEDSNNDEDTAPDIVVLMDTDEEWMFYSIIVNCRTMIYTFIATYIYKCVLFVKMNL